MIKPREFLDAIDDEKVIAAIHRAEASSGATIRVHVSHQSAIDPMASGRRAFDRFKRRHPDRHGRVLIFVAPQSQTFALHGDNLAHAACGPDGWQSLTDQLAAHFKTGDFTTGLVEAIETIAAQIAKARATPT